MSLFFFNDTATTEIYTLSLHDALPISEPVTAYDLVVIADDVDAMRLRLVEVSRAHGIDVAVQDRKSTRLNSSHANISYAVFCLKKKKQNINRTLFSFYTNTAMYVLFCN